MTNSDDMNTRAQALAAQLEQMRTDMYKLVDNAILNIARTCAGMSPEMVEQVIAQVFKKYGRTQGCVAAAGRGKKAPWSQGGVVQVV